MNTPENNLKQFKIAIGYPPIEQDKGVPLLSQNRQFQYFNSPTFIYPMVPAYAATVAKSNGYDVVWLDGIAEKWVYKKWLDKLIEEKPDLLMIETKAPVIKKHWVIINEIKKLLPRTFVVLVGDHVTYLPKESLKNSEVGFIITGGDYDFLLTQLADAITKNSLLPAGIWGRRNKIKLKLPASTVFEESFWNTGNAKLTHKLDELPFVDRQLTKWNLYAYENGNYKYTPATYMYSGRDCWWNRCTFCIWDHTLNPRGSYRRFSPERLFAEVKHVVDNLGVKEIFDDAGTFMIGPPLKKFCELMIESGYNKKVVFGCNMRLNALTQEYYDLMKKAGFRFILYGMESANQETLDKLDKGLKVAEIETGVRMVKKAGLEPHLTIMLGYPWETKDLAQNTINLARELFKKGLVDTMQATIVIPYPGSPLYKDCVKNGWLQVDPNDYEKFDMRQPVMKIPFSNERLMELTQALYSAFLSPQFIFRKIISIRSFDDIKFLFMSGAKLLAHLRDFNKSQVK